MASPKPSLTPALASDSPTPDPALPGSWQSIFNSYDALNIDPLNIIGGQKYLIFAVPQNYESQEGGWVNITVNNLMSFAVPAVNGVPILTVQATPQTEGEIHTEIQQAMSDLKEMQSHTIKFGAEDGAGAYSASASATIESTLETIADGSESITRTHRRRDYIELMLQALAGGQPGQSSNAALPPLDVGFSAKLLALGTETPNPSLLQAFVEQYGTHFTYKIRLGGVAMQEFTLNSSSFTTIVSSAVDLHAEAKASFKIAEVNGSVTSQGNLNGTYYSAIQGEVSSFTFIGGSASTDWEAWLPTVDGQPATIEVALAPLANLAVSLYFPDASATTLQKIQTNLNAYVLGYLQDNGEDLLASELNYGDQVILVSVPIASTANEVLVQQPGGAGTQAVANWPSGFAPIAVQAGASLSNAVVPKAAQWTLINPTSPTTTGGPAMPGQIALANVAYSTPSATMCLDAEAGSTGFLGNVGISALSGSLTPTQLWTVTWVQPKLRKKSAPLTHGDIVQLARVSSSPNPADPNGYLQVSNGLMVSKGSPQPPAVNGAGCYFRIFQLASPAA